MLRGRLRGRFTYPVRGRFMRPAHWSIKNQRAAHPIPIPDIHRSIGIGVRLVSAPCTGAPAHAGMAPPQWEAGHDHQRCPRPRGDGPKAQVTRTALYTVPPAHAGMAPTVQNSQIYAQRPCLPESNRLDCA